MEIKCEYCGSYISESLEKCPNCGAVNNNKHRTAKTTPKTIEELKQWYADRNLPPYETTRFFIGVDYQYPRAFGIYKDGTTGEFVVYKNKDTGERAIRYHGTDEAYAVNELYLKLKSEILNQKSAQLNHLAYKEKSPYEITYTKRTQTFGNVWLNAVLFFMFGLLPLIFYFAFGGFLTGCTQLIPLIFISLFVGLFTTVAIKNLFFNKKPKVKGIYIYIIVVTLMISLGLPNTKADYYKYNNTVYVHTGVDFDNNWYSYDTYTSDYVEVNKDYLPVDLQNNSADYEYDYSAIEKWDNSIVAFENSDYYNDNLTMTTGGGSSSDSSYDWGSSDSWDSGGTDWGSDW